jgi:hypothetical protein
LLIPRKGENPRLRAEIKILPACKGRAGKQEFKMKKKIGLVLLLITAVTVGTAFAKNGRNIPFKTFGNSANGKVNILKCEEVTTGLGITYTCESYESLTFEIRVFWNKDGKTSDKVYTNKEKIKKPRESNTMVFPTPNNDSITNVNITWQKTPGTDKEIAAEKILDAAASLSELEDYLGYFGDAIGVLNQYSEFKATVKALNDAKAMFEAGRKYKTAKANGREGTADEARREVLNSTLNVISFVGGKGLDSIRGGLLGIAVEGTQNAIKNMNAYFDNLSFTEAVGAGYPLDDYKYGKTVGVKMYKNGVSRDNIIKVLKALDRIENKR